MAARMVGKRTFDSCAELERKQITMAFHKAIKTKAKLRLALCGLAGTGKTYTSLKIASAISTLMRKHGHGDGRIAVIDSERGSASLYADEFNFDVSELDSFSPLSYVERIKEAEREGYDIIITDSLSHAWMGKDGALDQKDQVAERGGNSWTAWRNVTPKHNALVDAIVGSRSHVIATMRQKMEFVQEVNNGKTEIKKVGLAAIQREGMEFEFTCVGDLDLTHALKISKTRCNGYIALGDLFEKPGENFANRVYEWLMNGADPVIAALATVVAPAPDALTTAIDDTLTKYLDAMSAARDQVELDRVAGGSGKPAKGTPAHARATTHYLECKAKLPVAQAVAS